MSTQQVCVGTMCLCVNSQVASIVLWLILCGKSIRKWPNTLDSGLLCAECQAHVHGRFEAEGKSCVASIPMAQVVSSRDRCGEAQVLLWSVAIQFLVMLKRLKYRQHMAPWFLLYFICLRIADSAHLLSCWHGCKLLTTVISITI